MHNTADYRKLPYEIIHDPDELGFNPGARFTQQDMIFMLQLSVFAEGTVILHRLRKKLYEIKATEHLHKDTHEIYQKQHFLRDIADTYEQSAYIEGRRQFLPR